MVFDKPIWNTRTVFYRQLLLGSRSGSFNNCNYTVKVMAWFSGTNDDKGKYIVRLKQLLVPAIMTLVAISFSAIAEELRLLTWGGYAPEEVVSLFEKETGIVVQVTLSNNEDMISKLRTTYNVLRATGGSGFDLALALAQSS